MSSNTLFVMLLLWLCCLFNGIHGYCRHTGAIMHHRTLPQRISNKEIIKVMLMDPNLFYYNVDPNTVNIISDPNNSLVAFFDGLQSTFFKSVTLRLLGTIIGKKKNKNMIFIFLSSYITC